MKNLYALSLFFFAVQALAAPTLPTIPADTFSVATYGAKGDSSTNNTTSIQNTIAAAVKAGGGVVRFPAASKPYLSGPLTMSSKIELRVESGATLQMLPFGTYPMLSDSTYSPFISASNVTDIAITGTGFIEGNGSAWWTAYKAGTITHRPAFINVNSGTRINVSGIHLQNPPNVHMGFHYLTSNVTIQNMHIKTPGTSPNTDGTDLEGLHYLFTHDSIEDGDDNIAVQPSHDSTGDITVQDCFFGVGHGLSFGSWMQHGVNSFHAIRDTFVGTTSGIRMKAGRDRGGLTANISYTDIVMTNVQYPLYITSYYPSLPASPETDPAQAVTTTTPLWKNITITNLKSTSTTSGYRSIVIDAVPEAPVDSLTLINASFTAPDSFSIIHAHNLLFTNVTYKGSSTKWFGTEYDVTFRSSSSKASSSSIAMSSSAIASSSSAKVSSSSVAASSSTVASSSSVKASSSTTTSSSSTGTTAMIATNAEDRYSLMRNPNGFTLQETTGQENIEIIDIHGHLLESFPTRLGITSWSVPSTMPNGIYFLKLHSASLTRNWVLQSLQ